MLAVLRRTCRVISAVLEPLKTIDENVDDLATVLARARRSVGAGWYKPILLARAHLLHQVVDVAKDSALKRRRGGTPRSVSGRCCYRR